MTGRVREGNLRGKGPETAQPYRPLKSVRILFFRKRKATRVKNKHVMIPTTTGGKHGRNMQNAEQTAEPGRLR